MLSGDPDDTALAPPDALALGAERARGALASLGVMVESEPVVRRLDLAAEIRFAQAADGLLFSRAFGSLQLPGLEQNRRSSRQQTRSVTWSPAHGITLRLYDAGEWHATDEPGVRLRLERQLRLRKAKQAPPDSFSPTSIADLYLAPLARIIQSAPSIRILSPRAAELLIVEKGRCGELRACVAERLIGVVRISELCADALLYDRATASRRRSELRSYGVMLDFDGDDDLRNLDVREVLAALDARWRVGRGGER
jgi:hypothetical protein